MDKDHEEFIRGLHQKVALSLFEAEAISFLSQVAIVKHDLEENENRYVSVSTDVFDAYSFALFHPALDSVSATRMYIATELHRISNKSTTWGLKKALTNKLEDELTRVNTDLLASVSGLFELLKSLRFHYPTTSEYVETMLEDNRGRRLHSQDISIAENREVLRDNYSEWQLGNELESFLLHRDDGPIYSNYFFSIDNTLYAILVFIAGKDKAKLSSLPNIVASFFRSQKRVDDMQGLLEEWSKAKPTGTEAERLKKLEATLVKLSTSKTYEGDRTQSLIANIRKEIGRVKSGVNKTDRNIIFELVDSFESGGEPSPDEIGEWWKKISSNK